MSMWIRPAAVPCALSLALLAAACEPPPEKPPLLPTPEELRVQLSGLPFDDFVERSFRELLRRSPEAVVDLGLQSSIDVGHSFLDDVSDAFARQTVEVDRVVGEVLRAHDRAALSRPQQVTYDTYAWFLDDLVSRAQHADLRYPLHPALISVDLGTQFFFTDSHPLRSRSDVDDWLSRLGKVQAKFLQVRESVLRRSEAGIVLPRRLLDITRQNIQAISRATPRENPFYWALQARLEGVEGVDRQQALDRAERILRDSVIPAYDTLDGTLAALVGSAPTGLGVGQLPGGGAFYLDALRHHVTAPVTPDELEALGTSDLASIHAELEGRFAALGYPATNTLVQNIALAAQEGGIVPSSQVVAEYEAIIADAQSRLDQAFDLRPSADVIVIGVRSGGYYAGASLDGTRPGAFYATVSGSGEARFGMRTLAYHEAVPGHHLQIGIAQDLSLPLFQRVTTFTGYVEGWALYAEWMAGDLGWFSGDPHGDVGRLQSQAFRAARLVVDTGIHARGWSFDQAAQYLRDATGFGLGFCQGQVIRYASWPGQATSYWTGSKKIRGLRARAESAQGAAFDLKAFHRAVLSHGSLPLESMEQVAAEDLGLP